ncbi:MAG: cyanophycinase [Nitrospira sp.]
MYRTARQILFILLPLFFTGNVLLNAQSVNTVAAKGHLILCGGVGFPPEAVKRFVEYAGGPSSGIVFIASASTSIRLDNGFIYDIPEKETDSTAVLRQRFAHELATVFGVQKITVIDTREKAKANSKDYLQALKNANGVWLGPGNAGRYADAFLGTLFQKYLDTLLLRGGVVAGNSAGAIIQGSYIVRGRPDKPLLMAAGHEKGFGFLKNVVINPHLTSAKRETELVNVLDKYPQLLGIGIDDDISLVFTGNTFEILGKGIVAIYDNQLHNGKWWYLLQPGTKFDISKRQTVQ